MAERPGVAVTRATEDGGALVVALDAVGLRAVQTPLVASVMLDLAPLAARLTDGASIEWMVCTSRRAVEALGEACARAGVSPGSLQAGRVGAVGHGTARALEALGIAVDLVPATPDAEHLAQAIVATGSPPARGGRILFPRALAARDALPRILRAAGWVVDDVACYETRDSPAGGARLAAALHSGEVAAVTLTSGSTARALAALVPEAVRRDVPLISIGPTTTADARAAGLTISAEAVTPAMEALAEATRRVLLPFLTHA